MIKLLIASLRPGCGSTTVTANLAQALEVIKKQVQVIEADSVNLLGFHLGLSVDIDDGWAPRLIKGQDISAAGYISPHNVQFLPFGNLDSQLAFKYKQNWKEYQRAIFEGIERTPSSHGDWQLLHAQLVELEQLDMAHWEATIDLCFIVLTPTATSYALLQRYLNNSPTIQGLIELGKIRFVVNQHKPEAEIHRDFMLVLKKELGNLLLPVTLHNDTALVESVANLTTIQYYSPTSQATKDYQSLAYWCSSYILSNQEDKE